jgi:hypothetical protein
VSLDRAEADDSDADDSDADSSSSACALLGHILGAVPDAGRASAHAIRVALNRRSPPPPPSPPPPSLPPSPLPATCTQNESKVPPWAPGFRGSGFWVSGFLCFKYLSVKYLGC